MGTRMKQLVVVVMAMAAPAMMAAQDKIDVSGTWAFTVDTEAGTGTPTVTLK